MAPIEFGLQRKVSSGSVAQLASFQDKRGVEVDLTLAELERSLPNGIHDAALTSVHVDYAKREAIVGLNIDLSTPEATAASEGESYRPGRVVFSGLHFIAIDPQAPGYEYLGVSLIDSDGALATTSKRLVCTRAASTCYDSRA